MGLLTLPGFKESRSDPCKRGLLAEQGANKVDRNPFFSVRSSRCQFVAGFVFLLATVMAGAFCWGQKGPARLMLNPKNVLLQPTQTQPLTAKRAFLGGVAKMGGFQSVVAPLNWSSSNSAVASVDATTGLVTANNPGTAIITARAGPFSGSTNIIVTSNPLSAICISPSSATVFAGLTQQFSATGLFGSGSCPGSTNITASVTWSSANMAIATVSNAAGTEGLAKGISPGGPINITAAYGGVNASASLTVNPAVLLSITVTPNPANIPNSGGTLIFSATGSYSDGVNRAIPNSLTPSVNWLSSNPSIATISAGGVATAVAQNKTTITATDPITSISGSATLSVGPINAVTFYVAQNGNDSTFSGMLPVPNGNGDGPFASPARAQLAVESTAKGNPIYVVLRNGTYYLPLSPTKPGTLSFSGAADSGTSSNALITWENYPSETPIISGGVPVGAGGLGLTWTNVSGNLWQVQLPANVQATVPLQPFEYLFYNGERRLRSRLESSSGVGYYMNGSTCFSTQTGQQVSTSLCNLGTFLRVAAEVSPGSTGCPSVTNSNDATQSKCLDRFQYNPNDPVTTWFNLSGSYTGNPSSPCTVNASNHYPGGDVELTLFDAWTVDMMRVNCVDIVNHIIYFTAPTKGNTGVYNFFGPGIGHRYMVENTKDAFDAAQAAGQTGLWFLDRSNSQWILNYIANASENPNTDTVVIPQLGGVIPGAPATDYVGASLISATNLSYVTFQGITFETDNFIPSSTGFNNDVNGEMPLPQAIDCENCQNVTFDTVTVRYTSASGILFGASVRPPSSCGISTPCARLQNSTLYDIGDSPVRIGHMPTGSDTAAKVVQFVTVQNNLIQGYSRVFADGEGIAQGNGHDITYLHNDILDGYHAGISVCNLGCPGNPGANGTNIFSQYNHIRQIMQGITSDGGTLYYNIGGAQRSGTGDKIYNNLVHDTTDSSIIDNPLSLHGTGYGGEGIYLDAQSANVDVQNNVVYNMSASTAWMTNGPAASQQPNTFNNNIFAYGRFAMFAEQSPWPQGCDSNPRGVPLVNITNNIFYFDLNDQSNLNSSRGFYVVQGCAYSCGLPYNQFQNFAGNLYWRTDGAFAGYSKAFHVLTKAPANASSCGEPGNPTTAWTSLTFNSPAGGNATWQNGTAPPLPVAMNEDAGGTVAVNPQTINPTFGNSNSPTDYLLNSAPLPGFNNAATNDTINNAGQTNPSPSPGIVPATFPTYNYATF